MEAIRKCSTRMLSGYLQSPWDIAAATASCCSMQPTWFWGATIGTQYVVSSLTITWCLLGTLNCCKCTVRTLGQSRRESSKAEVKVSQVRVKGCKASCTADCLWRRLASMRQQQPAKKRVGGSVLPTTSPDEDSLHFADRPARAGY